MQAFGHDAASAYRRVDLDARVEAASGEELTRICLEEAVAALGQAVKAIEKHRDAVPRENLLRAHSITLWLARGVEEGGPLSSALTQFYGGIAATISRNLMKSSLLELARVRNDLNDILKAARGS